MPGSDLEIEPRFSKLPAAHKKEDGQGANMSDTLSSPRARAPGGLAGRLLRPWRRGSEPSSEPSLVPSQDGEGREAPAAPQATAAQPEEAPVDPREIAIRGQEKVIAHYRRLLAHTSIPEMERLDLESRLAKAEAALQEFAA
jgi:hypothetical protein